MAPKTKVSNEEILAAGLAIVRREGVEALNARTLARELNCPTQPIFSRYRSMKELQYQVLKEAYGFYETFIEREMASSELPYKASGMAYIRFARQERNLFRWLFMRDRTGEQIGPPDAEPQLLLLQKNLGLTRQEAEKRHLEMWVVVHGIASMAATAYLELDEKTISGILSDVFLGLQFCIWQ